MCFSAEVSFAAAGVLTILGVQTVRATEERWQLPLAVIPLLFALHQFSEGVMWLFFRGPMVPNEWFFGAQWFYVLMAYILFPFWLPFSVLCLENIPWRRRVIMGITLMGAVVAMLNLDRLPGEQVLVKTVGHSLQYPLTDWTRGVPYILSVCGAFLFSSRRYVWAIGVAGFVSAAVTYAVYYWTFASVWCFFAAMISTAIYIVIRELHRARLHD